MTPEEAILRDEGNVEFEDTDSLIDTLNHKLNPDGVYTITQIMSLIQEVATDLRMEKRVRDCLRKMGWQKDKHLKTIDGYRARYWTKIKVG